MKILRKTNFIIFVLLMTGMLLSPSFARVSAGSPQVDGEIIELVSLNNQYIEIDLNLPTYQIENLNVDGQNCDRVYSDGMGTNGSPGQPQLPTKGVWIGLPIDGSPTLEILSIDKVILPGPYNICPVSEPYVETNLEGEIVRTGSRLKADAQLYASGLLFPDSPVQFSEIGYLRSQRVGIMSFQPFQFRTGDGSLSVIQHMRVRINLPESRARVGNDPSFSFTEEASFEAMLKDVLLNYQQAISWRQPANQSHSASNVLSSSMLGDYKILVYQDGLYQLSYSALQNAGIPVDSLDPKKLKITNQGNEVRILVIGEGDGVFGRDDYILFYGQQMHTKFTKTNVYWLSWTGADGLRMQTIDGTPGTATIPSQFFTREHLEMDKIYQPSRPSGASKDHWYWEGLQVSGAAVNKYFYTTLTHISFEPGTAMVRGLLKGMSASPQHKAKIYLNDQLIHTTTWVAGGEYSFEVPVAQSDLINGQNKLTVEAVYGDGITSQTFFVNWLEIDYADTFRAANDLLNFDGDSAGVWDFQIGGFSTNVISVFDITNPSQPLQVQNVTISDLGGSYQAAFHHSITNEHKYLALTNSQWLKPQPADIIQDTPSDLMSTTNGADYIVITHVDLTAQAQQLVDYRSGPQMRTMLVDVQNVYDEFSYGVFDPGAIQEFLAYAYQNWQSPAPAYVVLFGDGHYDFQNFLTYNQPILIPPFLGEVDPWFGETAADNRFVMITGEDILPDMNIGRLPARTAGEAQAMVTKIINYESNPPTDDWNTRALFVADNPDSGGDFYLLSNNAFTQMPATYTKDKVYYGQNYGTAGEAKTAIKNAINQGRLLVSFIGHGSTQWWTAEKIFELNDLPALTNQDRLTFMLPMTCYEGYFINPASNSQALAESVVRAENKGAIASFSPTGQGVATGHDVLEEGLFDALFNHYEDKIGPATTQAKLYLYANGFNFSELVDTYILFGDPATRINSIEAISTKYLYLPLLNQH